MLLYLVMKTTNLLLILIAVILSIGIYFTVKINRYEYNGDKVMRVDKLTGRVEVFNITTKSWGLIHSPDER
jgi:hypothetical protein